MNYRSEILNIINICAETGNNMTEAIEALKIGKNDKEKQKIVDAYKLIIANPSLEIRKLLEKYYEKVLHKDISEIDYSYGLLVYYKKKYYNSP